MSRTQRPGILVCTGDDGCPACGKVPALTGDLPAPTIDARFMYSWSSQVEQYPKMGAPGIEVVVCHFAAPGTSAGRPMTADGIRQLYCELDVPEVWDKEVWTLLYRNRKGRVVGILNYYPQELPEQAPGDVNIWVKEQCRGGGIGTKLVDALVARRWRFTWEQQSYSMAGHSFITSYLAKKQESQS